MSSGCSLSLPIAVGRRMSPIGSAMNFRLVWVGSDDDSDASQLTLKHHDVIQDRVRSATGYEIRGGEMVRRQQLNDGSSKFTPLANFTARIIGDMVLDDEVEPRREFAVEAEWSGKNLTFSVPAAEFGSMGWVLKKLGPQAIIYPGQHQHTRAAIQWLSGAIKQKRIFSRTGWCRDGADWLYLQAGGALGSEGLRRDVQVELPGALEHYRIEPAVGAEERSRAIRASLRILSAAPARITWPLLAAVYRAPLGKVDFSLFLAGRSGVFKTALAALCQQHFGAEMDARVLPAHFGSTANSLEELAFQAKDALLVVDDFVPTGGADDGLLHGTAERLFRAAGNRQGRGRMSGPGRLRPPRPPRALVLATGEQVPRGRSLRARLLIVEVQPGDVDRSVLSECQDAARQGEFAAAMAAYLSWIATRYEDIEKRQQTRVRDLRNRPSQHVSHARLSAAMAELQSGWEIWLQFALEAGAIGEEEHAGLVLRSSEAMAELAAIQAPYQFSGDPSRRFLALLQSALATGQAHIADREGCVPETPSLWGWRRKFPERKWIGCGARLGWIDGNDLYLDSSASYQAATKAAQLDPLELSEQTPRRRLHDCGMLATIDGGRQTLLVRRTLDGCSRHVLHRRADDLI